MGNLVNVPEVLTFRPAKNDYVVVPGQVFLRGGPTAQPFVGATRDRPARGQIWPRGEYTSDKAVGNNIPAPPGLVATVTVTPATATIFSGGSPSTVLLTATLLDGNGTPITAPVLWVSSDPSKATVSTTGLVTAVAAGSTTISAVSQGKVGTATITVIVTPPAVATVTVTPTPFGLAVGKTLQLSAFVFDGSGNVLTGRTVTWATSNSLVATVSASGLVTGVATGTVTITATSETIPGTASGTILPAPIVSDPLIYYPLDETSGTTVWNAGRLLDAQGRPFPLTATSESIIDAKKNKGRQLTAELGGLFTIPANEGGPAFAIMGGNSSWSVSLWMNRGLGTWFDTGGADRFMSVIGVDDIENNLVPYARMVPLAWRRIGTNPSRLVTEFDLSQTRDWGITSSTFPSGWNHVAVVNNIASNTLRCYLNGVEIGAVLAANVSAYASGRFKWYLQLTQGWGAVDEVYVFDRALTGAEVTTLASI
jgi:hypothetical protein